jgi:outer membrane protein assembly factor BamD (BamD/ComL family)
MIVMKNKLLVPFLLLVASLDASYTLKDGHFINEENLATNSVQEHHSAALEALHSKNWSELIRQATIILESFPNTPFSQESRFFLAKGYLETGELDLANENYTIYLKKQDSPKHFQEAMEGKLFIADQFRDGKKKRMFGVKVLPKWAPAKEEAQKIYDEIATAMPNHEFAAKALMGKSLILFEEEDFKPAIEHLQTLIRRFPRNDLAAQAFLEINRIYLKEVQEEFPDPGVLELAQINLRKFQMEFPTDPRVENAKDYLSQMQEIYAFALYDTGQFFERTKKPHAALIYYRRVLRDFPSTPSAKKASSRIAALSPATPAQDTQEIAKSE